MTNTESYLAEISGQVLETFHPVFDTIEKFYDTIYLIVKNEHVLSTDKPDMWEEKSRTVQWFKEKIEKRLNDKGLSGKDIVADIASDYFEDYVHYRERDHGLTNDEFLNILRQIQNLN